MDRLPATTTALCPKLRKYLNFWFFLVACITILLELLKQSLTDSCLSFCLSIFRPTICMYDRIGCPWRGPFHEQTEHHENCIHPKKSGAEVMDMLFAMDKKKREESTLYDHIFSLLSYEKITFSGEPRCGRCLTLCPLCIQ